jgi:phosphoribosylformimino-5-aminoimidazole carboxamide ribotide isomerase
MVILPAIDLKDGRCVRLHQGDMATAVVYGGDPAGMARRWADEGAGYLHVVDLDGAFAGYPVNAVAIRAICTAVSIPVEVGGGVRDAATVSALLDGGVARVILGTAAYSDPGFVADLCAQFPGRIAVGIDARDGEVAGKGWVERSGVRAVDLAETVARAGVACVIYTDIARDGTETGPNIEATRAIAQVLAPHGVSVIASGGVGALADVARVATLGPDGVAGLIIGRALYTGAVTLPEAMAAIRGDRVPPSETLPPGSPKAS